MGKAHERLHSTKEWRITDIDPASGMEAYANVGARFRVNGFGDQYFIELLQGFHPALPRSVAIAVTDKEKEVGRHPPHPVGETPDPEFFAFKVLRPGASELELWLVLTWKGHSSKDIATLGTPSPLHTHGGAHGIDD